MKKTNNQNIKDSLSGFLDHYRLKEKSDEFKLLSSWEKIVGATIGKYTDEIKVSQKRLYLKLNSSTVKHQLMISREQVIQLVNETMGEGYIKEIVFL